MRILFASPAYWPARAFGGPVAAARELVARLVERGHAVEVVTTSLTDIGVRPARTGRVDSVDGATVHYLATPLRYRWMGITPGLPLTLRRLERPDVVHVFGFRDPVTTLTSRWARRRGIPTVFEPLGMFEPRLRKVRFKRIFDATVASRVATRADAVVVVSALERDAVLAGGVQEDRIVVRGNGFPEPREVRPDDLRGRLGISEDAPIVLYVGRIAAGKGIEILLAAVERLPEIHLVLLGPDDGHGVLGTVRAASRSAPLAGRVHVLPATPTTPFPVYAAADLLVLPSSGDSFGLVAAEAAAVGTPVVVTDHCGVASFFREGEALVVPARADDVIGAISRAVADPALRLSLAEGGRRAAARTSWDHVTTVQEQVYRAVASRTAVTKLSTLAG